MVYFETFRIVLNQFSIENKFFKGLFSFDEADKSVHNFCSENTFHIILTKFSRRFIHS